MSDTFNAPKDISKMDFKELRAEVQLLWDEMARMKRGYEDAIYNLDYDNFSSRVMKDQKGMQTSIEQTAEKITLQAEAVEESTKSITELQVSARKITARVAEVEDGVANSYSLIEQNAEKISLQAEKITDNEKNIAELSVTANKIESSVKALGDADKELSTKITQTADGITSTVSELSGDVDALSSYAHGLSDDISGLSGSVSSIRQTANEISSKVSDLEAFKTSTFTQTADGFTLDGEKTTFTGVVFLTDDSGDKRVGLFHDESQNFAQVILRKYSKDYCPLVIEFDDGDVYIGSITAGNEVATRSWVLENAGSGGTGGYAVFG